MFTSEAILYLTTGAALGATGGLAAGPLTALVISQTLRFGLKEGLAVAWAPVLTDGPLLIAGALLMNHLQSFSGVMGVISSAGALFLLWLAWDCIKGANVQPNERAPEAPKSIKKAILTNLLNPHPYLFWFFAGGPLIAEAWGVSMTCIAAFLGGFFSCLVGSKMGIALVTHHLGNFIGGKVYRWIMWFLAGTIVMCAAYFVLEAFEHFGIPIQSFLPLPESP